MGIERRRPRGDSPRLTLARLAGTSGRLAHISTPVEEAAAELRTITTDPVLLGQAAGSAAAAAEFDSVVYPWAAKQSEYLVAAGVGDEAMKASAAKTSRSLKNYRLGVRR